MMPAFSLYTFFADNQFVNVCNALDGPALNTLILLGMLLALVAGYAEIHYKLPGIPSILYKKEPELLFDLPFRGEFGKDIPLFLFIKDAHLYPVNLLQLEVAVLYDDKATETLHYSIMKQSEARFQALSWYLPASAFNRVGDCRVTASLQYEVAGKQHSLQQDNYNGISHEPFRIYIAATPLPELPGLYWGDLHVHSNYTTDQIEFAASIRETAMCGKAVGMHFLAITDHSYDMDDYPEDYTRNDPQLKKWQAFWQEVDQLNDTNENFVVIGGEEVSVGNTRKENVHCLVMGNRTFYPGTGDGGERPLRNKPSLQLPALYQQVAEKDPQAIIAAAHPFDVPPAAQRLLLNRGHWHSQDLFNEQLDYWQILNGRLDAFFQNGYATWQKALLQRLKIGVLGGTDAHGNFNNFRQLTMPFYKMIKHHEQLLGQARTGIFLDEELSEFALMSQLHRKRTIISTGPAAVITGVSESQVYHIGETAPAEHSLTLKLTVKSSDEFGALTLVKLYQGNYESGREEETDIDEARGQLAWKGEMQFPEGISTGYLRLEVQTEKAGHTAICLTNPIWFE